MRKVTFGSLALIVALMLAGVSILPTQPTVVAQGGLIRVVSPADITGTGATVQIVSSGQARWIQVIAASGNGAAVRCGDSTASASRGLPIAAGGAMMFPSLTDDWRESPNQHLYAISSFYCYIANGDSISVAYAQ